MKFKLLFGALLCLPFSFLIAQNAPSYKFEKITAADFAPASYPIDPDAAAVILSDVGSSEFEGNKNGGFSLIFKRRFRARILKAAGYDVAVVKIPLYSRKQEEEDLKSLKAVTYNLENGKVNDAKLEKSSIFKEQVSENLALRKFTFPNVKEGCIIEMEYKIVSDFTDFLRAWDFQRDYPILWSEYVVSIPEYFQYTTLTQGYHPFFVNERKDRLGNFTIEEARVNAGITAVTSAGAGGRTSVDATISDFRWVMKDVPAIREEAFTSALRNHIAGIRFQIAEVKTHAEQVSYLQSWPDAMDDLLRNERFAYLVNNRDNGWMTDEMNDAIRNAKDELGKARCIYYYIRDNITSTGKTHIFLDKPLRTVLKNRNGSAAEINLLLTAMLLKAGFKAEPVILSTRNNGFVYTKSPIINQFNHAITRLTIDGKKYYLDASVPMLGFGKLDLDTYNGEARVVDAAADAIDLSPNALAETKVTAVVLKNDKSGGFSGTIQELPGYYESLNVRSQVKRNGQKQFFASLKNGLPMQPEFSGEAIDSLTTYEEPVNIRLNIKFTPEASDILYINPMLVDGWKDNPFKSTQRSYPVEMPYKIDQFYQLKMDVPEGYKIEELPAQVKIKINAEEDGLFEYLIAESNGVISLSSRLRVRRTFFGPQEYDKLREFFALVVKKHSEQIVFKKK